MRGTAAIVPIVLAGLLIASGAAAHPGHGEPGQGWTLLHHLREPIHVVGLIALVLGALATLRVLRQRAPGRRTIRR